MNTWIVSIVLALGECCLLLDMSNRLLGSYKRACPRTLMRVSAIVFACVCLALPLSLSRIHVDGPERFYLFLSCGLSLACVVNFPLPYRFGIRRLATKPGLSHKEPLTRCIALLSVTTEMPATRQSVHTLLLSDLHCNTRRAMRELSHYFDRLRSRCYDMIFLLGDIGEDEHLIADVMHSVADLKARHGIFCVRGNHDFEGRRSEAIRTLCNDLSLILLSNTTYEVPELQIQIVGLENPWEPGPLPSRPNAPFAIGLTHTPDNIRVFNRLGVPLVLAGHTHGGRVTIPLAGSALVPSRYGRFLDKGWFRYGDTRMYVTPGIGYRPGFLGRHGMIVELRLSPCARNAGGDTVNGCSEICSVV